MEVKKSISLEVMKEAQHKFIHRKDSLTSPKKSRLLQRKKLLVGLDREGSPDLVRIQQTMFWISFLAFAWLEHCIIIL
jgi:hypothetical protein